MTRSRILRLAAHALVAIAALAGLAFGGKRFVDTRLQRLRVFDARQAAVEVVQRCRPQTGDARLDCYGKALSDVLGQRGVAAAATLLDVLGSMDTAVAEGGHVLAHGIGIEAYTRSPDVAGTFVACGDAYSSGCRHGVIQAYFESRDHVAAAEVNALCRPFHSAVQSTWVLFQCVHGMGHGLTMFYGHNLPQALTGCDLLQDAWDRESCYGGAFMENIVNATAPHHPASMLAMHHHHMATTPFKALDPGDMLYPCSIVADKYLGACYLMQTSAILYLNHGDIPGAGVACARTPVRYRSICFQSLGRDITAYTNRNTQASADACAGGGGSVAADRHSCYVGVVKALVDWTATTDSAFAFCRLAGAAGDPGSDRCYRALGEQVAALIWSDADRAARCAQAESRSGVLACRAGAGVRRSGV